jgi:hypothetical protein
MDEFFETLTLIQTLKVEAFPIILYGAKFWSGLVEWMRASLIPHYIDPEDIDIFHIADSPQEVVKQIVAGVKKHWWKPLDADLQYKTGTNGKDAQTPLSGPRTADTGEGTRYGKRPRRPQKEHAASPRKPQQ